MSIPETCACGKQLQAPDEYAGKRVKCPACGSAFAVPLPEPEPAGEEPEAPPDDEHFAEQPRSRDREESNPFAFDDDERDRERGRDRDRDRDRGRDRDWDRGRDLDVRRERPKPVAQGGITNAGVGGGLLAMGGAALWFCVGLFAFDRFFFYPPILFILGLIAVIKGLAGGGDRSRRD
jgi:hypothetical protein